jgi:hypothetical protein
MVAKDTGSPLGFVILPVAISSCATAENATKLKNATSKFLISSLLHFNL